MFSIAIPSSKDVAFKIFHKAFSFKGASFNDFFDVPTLMYASFLNLVTTFSAFGISNTIISLPSTFTL